MEDKKELEEELRIDESLRAKLEDQDLGTHLCCIYRNKEEQLSALSSFMSLGIERNDKCLYVVDDRTKEEVIEAFESLGFDVENFVESGQFEFMTKSESYLEDDYFDPDEMINLLEEAKEKALEEGYNGLRATGEMTWFFSDMPGVERLMEYETKLNEFLPDQKIIALCQYNEEKFTPETLVDVLHTHPKVLIYNDLHENTLYMPPRVFRAQQEGNVTQEHYESMKEGIFQRTRLGKEKEEAKKRLEEEKERAQKYLDIAGTIIVVIDENRKVEQINQRGCEILGYGKEEIIGKDWYENYVPERVRRDVLEDTRKPLMNGRVEEGKKHENPILTKDGEERIITWENTVLKNDDGEITGTLSSGMDITERKEMEERKEFLSTLLRQDLKNKYMIIHGYYQLLEEEADLLEEQRKYLKKSIKAAREADEILGLAKKLDKIEETKRIEEKDIINILKLVLDTVSGLVKSEGVEVEENYPETISEVKGDYSLNTLFAQLLEARIQLGECSKIRIKARERGEDILLRIEDDGEKLPGDVKNLFTGKVYIGDTSGVGGVRYYILREIARHNNAKIEVKDSELGGAKFEVRLKKA